MRLDGDFFDSAHYMGDQPEIEKLVNSTYGGNPEYPPDAWGGQWLSLGLSNVKSDGHVDMPA
jgi:hypothetical protein